MHFGRVGLLVVAMLTGCQQMPLGRTPSQTAPLNLPPEAAASAMTALRAGMDTAANNLSNAGTPGFKATQLVLSEVAPAQRALTDGNENHASAAILVGAGVRVSATRLDMRQGPAVFTGRDLDVMIEGGGFFRVRLPNSEGLAYSRCGSWVLNGDGQLVYSADPAIVLEPAITIPSQAIPPVRISADGRVMVQLAGSPEPQEVGQIELASFANPEGLRPIGGQLFVETSKSGPPMSGAPGQDANGSLRQTFLEGSNVNPDIERLNFLRLSQLYQAWNDLAFASLAGSRGVAMSDR